MPTDGSGGTTITTVHVHRALDLASGDQTRQDSQPVDGDDVAGDVMLLTLLDWAGYGALAAAQRDVRSHGRKLTVVNANGEPVHVLGLITDLEWRATQ